jgi:hypothetical protein
MTKFVPQKQKTKKKEEEKTLLTHNISTWCYENFFHLTKVIRSLCSSQKKNIE